MVCVLKGIYHLSEEKYMFQKVSGVSRINKEVKVERKGSTDYILGTELSFEI